MSKYKLLFIYQNLSFVLVFAIKGRPCIKKLKSKIKPDGRERCRQRPPYVCLSPSHDSQLSPKLSPSRLAPRDHSLGIRLSTNIQFHQSVLTAFMSTAHNQSLPSPPASICVAKIVFSRGAFHRSWKVTEETGGAVALHPGPDKSA